MAVATLDAHSLSFGYVAVGTLDAHSLSFGYDETEGLGEKEEDEKQDVPHNHPSSARPIDNNGHISVVNSMIYPKYTRLDQYELVRVPRACISWTLSAFPPSA
jgi:hypothetical protein